VDTIGFTGLPFNYINFCSSHRELAKQDAQRWLAEHPGVMIAEDD
jgi:hypothetical protein